MKLPVFMPTCHFPPPIFVSTFVNFWITPSNITSGWHWLWMLPNPCSVEKVFLEISQNSQENTCAKVSFFKKVAGLTPANLLKKRLWHSYFSANFEKFLITPSFIEHLRWLLLNSEILKMTFFWNWKFFGFCKQTWDNNDIFGS